MFFFDETTMSIYSSSNMNVMNLTKRQILKTETTWLYFCFLCGPLCNCRCTSVFVTAKRKNMD
jgi:hypothetical protein